MRIYISADMEGVAGVVTDAQLGPEGFDWQKACDLYTDEVIAVIEELRAGGATEIVVSDSHGTGQNLRIERLPPGVQLVRSWPRRLGMMEGIDRGEYAGAVLLGYHAGAHNPSGVRAHTMSSAHLFEVAINGRPACEAEISAWLAGHFDVPILMLSGDDAIAAEIEGRIPCECAVTKRALSFHSALSMTPADAIDALRRTVRRALERRAEIPSTALEGPVTLDLTMQRHRPAELLGYLPNVEQLDAHTVRFVGRDILEASAFFEFVLNYSPELAP